MAAPTMEQRQHFSLNRITVKNWRNHSLYGYEFAIKKNASRWLKSINGSFSNVRKQPIRKQHRARIVIGRDMPHGPQPLENAHTVRAKNNVPICIHDRNAHTMFQRKSWQDVFQKSGISNFTWCGQRKVAVLRVRRDWQQSTAEYEGKFHINPSVRVSAT